MFWISHERSDRRSAWSDRSFSRRCSLINCLKGRYVVLNRPMFHWRRPFEECLATRWILFHFSFRSYLTYLRLPWGSHLAGSRSGGHSLPKKRLRPPYSLCRMSRASFERLTVPPHQIGQRLAGFVALPYKCRSRARPEIHSAVIAFTNRSHHSSATTTQMWGLVLYFVSQFRTVGRPASADFGVNSLGIAVAGRRACELSSRT